MVTANDLIEQLNLKIHPVLGGYFGETYRSNTTIQNNKALSIVYYFLLTPQTHLTIHKLQSDKIFHFYYGDPVRIVTLPPEGTGKEINCGSDLKNGMTPQVIVPGNAWQGAKLQKGGRYALLGITTAFGSELDDYEIGNEEDLIKKFPEQKDLITKLT